MKTSGQLAAIESQLPALSSTFARISTFGWFCRRHDALFNRRP
jgi:hypothetical protein